MVRIKIFTVAFRKVFDLYLPSVAPGSSYSLDLKDIQGNSLANGVYYVNVSALTTASNIPYVWTGKAFVLK
jgi:hypothetical protein